jgi:hypothetical protein
MGDRISPALAGGLAAIEHEPARYSNETVIPGPLNPADVHPRIFWHVAESLVARGWARYEQGRSVAGQGDRVEITDDGRTALRILRKQWITPGMLDALALLAGTDYAVESNRTQPATDRDAATILGRVSIKLRRAELVRSADGWGPASGRVEITDAGREVVRIFGEGDHRGTDGPH